MRVLGHPVGSESWARWQNLSPSPNMGNHCKWASREVLTGKAGERSVRLNGSSSLAGTSRGSHPLLSCLSSFHLLPPPKSSPGHHPHPHAHSELNLGDLLPRCPLSPWMRAGQEGARSCFPEQLETKHEALGPRLSVSRKLLEVSGVLRATCGSRDFSVHSGTGLGF